mmetsp:Transcript_18409/g.58258  ORF Transcript_18409/g.58258 Transcript_18409/m.58258 type:complete len:262 (+) Transcript_18409:338-1123(+)
MRRHGPYPSMVRGGSSRSGSVSSSGSGCGSGCGCGGGGGGGVRRITHAGERTIREQRLAWLARRVIRLAVGLIAGGRPARYCLHLQKLSQSPFAALPAQARALHATKRRAGGVRRAVDLDHSGRETAGQAASTAGVGGLNVGGETVHRVVCYVDGVALIVERNHAQNRPEDLLPCDGMAAVVHVSEERRPDVVANLVPGRLSLTSRQQRGALLDAGPDEALHPVELRRVDEGADVRARHVGRSYLGFVDGRGGDAQRRGVD